MTIYEINKAMQDILDGFEVIDEETGEIMDLSSLDELQMLKEEKCENLACYIKSLKAEADAIAAEAKKLRERHAAIEKKRERLTQYLSDSLAGEKLKSARVSVSYRRSESVNVLDVSVLPEDLCKVKVEPDKEAIKKLLKAGESVDGAELVSNTSTIIK